MYEDELTGPRGATQARVAGMLSTRAVETLDGWVGQVLVDDHVVVESSAFEVHGQATAAARELVAAKVTALFTVPVLTGEVEATPEPEEKDADPEKLPAFSPRRRPYDPWDAL